MPSDPYLGKRQKNVIFDIVTSVLDFWNVSRVYTDIYRET